LSYNHDHLYSQEEHPCNKICKNRKIGVITSTSLAFSGGMYGLYQLWYADYPQSNFHFFNDNKQWLQMDKLGHSYTAYSMGEAGFKAAQFACFNKSQSIWLGGGVGLLFLSTVETFDGFSKEWGASYGDLIANTTGYLLFATQQQIWDEQRLRLKFSYFPSQYSQYRPSVLGNSFASRIIKDYNAQTYWLSFSPIAFTKESTSFFPPWLCLSIGYSADGMLGGEANPHVYNGQILPNFVRQRQLFLSLDIDFSKIETNSKVLQNVFYFMNFIKIPFPALYYGTHDGSGYKWMAF
jgi:hypothetical protein